MSYDVDIGDREFNYTYNLFQFFRDFIYEEGNEQRGIQLLDGKTGKEAVKLLGDAFERISYAYAYKADGYKGFSEIYDAKNGWGDTYGATLFLAQIMTACAQNKKKRVKVS